MPELNQETINARLMGMLSGQDRGTTADLTDFALAYWDGAAVRYLFLHEDGHGALDEHFDLTDFQIDEWHDQLVAWFGNPRFSEKRPELIEWLDRTAEFPR
jgi:hypothetical protein